MAVWEVKLSRILLYTNNLNTIRKLIRSCNHQKLNYYKNVTTPDLINRQQRSMAAGIVIFKHNFLFYFVSYPYKLHIVGKN